MRELLQEALVCKRNVAMTEVESAMAGVEAEVAATAVGIHSRLVKNGFARKVEMGVPVPSRLQEESKAVAVSEEPTYLSIGSISENESLPLVNMLGLADTVALQGLRLRRLIGSLEEAVEFCSGLSEEREKSEGEQGSGLVGRLEGLVGAQERALNRFEVALASLTRPLGVP